MIINNYFSLPVSTDMLPKMLRHLWWVCTSPGWLSTCQQILRHAIFHNNNFINWRAHWNLHLTPCVCVGGGIFPLILLDFRKLKLRFNGISISALFLQTRCEEFKRFDFDSPVYYDDLRNFCIWHIKIINTNCFRCTLSRNFDCTIAPLIAYHHVNNVSYGFTLNKMFFVVLLITFSSLSTLLLA